MIVVCKGCDTKYQLKDKLAAGKAGKAQCKRCGDTFWVVNPAPKQEVSFFDQKAALNSFGMDNVIVFSNQKGGVAKTSTCLNLGLSLALLKKRVLMIDFDIRVYGCYLPTATWRCSARSILASRISSFFSGTG
jgi:chromosome partitioning protein